LEAFFRPQLAPKAVLPLCLPDVGAPKSLDGGERRQGTSRHHSSWMTIKIKSRIWASDAGSSLSLSWGTSDGAKINCVSFILSTRPLSFNQQGRLGASSTRPVGHRRLSHRIWRFGGGAGARLAPLLMPDIISALHCVARRPPVCQTCFLGFSRQHSPGPANSPLERL